MNVNKSNSMSLEPSWSTPSRGSNTAGKRMRVGNDPIDSLPDCVLVDIISLLPLRTAASTSVLSRRWRYLWTQTTNYVLDVSNYMSAETCTLVDHIIQQLSAPKICRFELEFRDWSGEDHQRDLVQSWIRNVYDKNAEEIKVNITRPYPSNLIPLPPYIFQSKSLVSLSLSSGFDYELPADGNINISLPNLKRLEIVLHKSRRELSATLFKSCTLLEYLRLTVRRRWEQHYNFCVDISGQNLRELIVEHDDQQIKHTKFLINAPNLRRISCHGSRHSYFRFLEHPTGLVEADISIIANKKYSRSRMLKIVEGICSTSSLVVSTNSHHFLGYSRHANMPTVCFNNLTKLRIDHWGSHYNWSVLLLFQHGVPSLQVLELYSTTNKFECMDGGVKDWTKFAGISSCLSSSVRRIRIEWLKVTKKNWDFLAYLLRISSVLEQLIVKVKCDNYLRAESELCRDLFLYPRSSEVCVIEISTALSSKSIDSSKMDQFKP